MNEWQIRFFLFIQLNVRLHSFSTTTTTTTKQPSHLVIYYQKCQLELVDWFFFTVIIYIVKCQ